jgi:hypothetical protein
MSFCNPMNDFLRTSRLRLKPLEVKDKSFEEVLNEITELVEMNSYWFLGSRPVFIRFLQKLFWGDMGVGFVGTEVFSTTHVSSLNIGLTKEIIEQHSIDLHNLGTYLRETSVDLGRYVGALAEVLGVPLDVTDRSAEASPPTLGYRDYQSARFYERLSASISSILAVNVMVMALISQTNVARLLVPVLAGQNELASLKLRLLSLYHAKIALGRLLGENRRVPILQPDAQNYIRAALDSPHVQNIARNRLLRNAFIHYGVEAREAVNLTKALPLNGFIEAHTEGQSLAEVELDVTLGLDHLSKNLRLLLPEGLAPKRNFA